MTLVQPLAVEDGVELLVDKKYPVTPLSSDADNERVTLDEAVELAPLLMLMEGLEGGSSCKFIESEAELETFPAPSLNQT